MHYNLEHNKYLKHKKNRNDQSSFHCLCFQSVFKPGRGLLLYYFVVLFATSLLEWCSYFFLFFLFLFSFYCLSASCNGFWFLTFVKVVPRQRIKLMKQFKSRTICNHRYLIEVDLSDGKTTR